MKPIDVLRQLLADVRADSAECEALRGLLEAQFQAALRHDAVRLGEIGARIVERVEVVDGHRRERVALVAALGLGARASMNEALALLAAPSRAAAGSAWQALEQRLRDCKALNERNCRLMTEQHALMQRVLAGEEDIYVPA